MWVSISSGSSRDVGLWRALGVAMLGTSRMRSCCWKSILAHLSAGSGNGPRTVFILGGTFLQQYSSRFFFFFKYRESVCCRTHGSFLLRVVLCRGKICRAGPLSFSSSSSTPALGLPALGSAICAAGKEPQTLGFLVASHLHHNLLQTVSSWPSIATCMQQALKPLPSLAWKQFLGLSLHSPRIFTHKSHLAAVVLITPFMGLLPPLQATVGPQQCPSSSRGPYVERTGLAPNPQASTPFPGSHFPFLQMKGFPLPPQQDNFPVMRS